MLPYPESRQWAEIVRIQSTGLGYALGRVQPSPEIANARVVINGDGLVIKDADGQVPRAPTEYELAHAVTL